MKKAALVAAALAMVLSLAACGNKDNNTANDPANGSGTTENGGSVNNGGTNSDNNGTANNNGTNGTGTGSGVGGDSGMSNGAGAGAGASVGAGSVTGSGTDTGVGAGTGTGSSAGTGTGSGTASGRSTVGSDLRRAADDVGDAVTGLMDDGRSAVARGTSTTTFQRMLDNARVHDVDGVLTDGENSRW